MKYASLLYLAGQELQKTEYGGHSRRWPFPKGTPNWDILYKLLRNDLQLGKEFRAYSISTYLLCWFNQLIGKSKQVLSKLMIVWKIEDTLNKTVRWPWYSMFAFLLGRDMKSISYQFLIEWKEIFEDYAQLTFWFCHGY